MEVKSGNRHCQVDGARMEDGSLKMKIRKVSSRKVVSLRKSKGVGEGE